MMALPSPASNQKWQSCLANLHGKQPKILTMSIFTALAPRDAIGVAE
jgi:hypothetical protein